MKGQTVRVSAFIILYFIYWTVSSWQPLRPETDWDELARYHHTLRTPVTLLDTHNSNSLFDLKKADSFQYDNIRILWYIIKYQHFNKKYGLSFYLSFTKLIFYNEKLNILGSNFVIPIFEDAGVLALTPKICLPLEEILLERLNFCLNLWQGTKIIFSP